MTCIQWDVIQQLTRTNLTYKLQQAWLSKHCANHKKPDVDIVESHLQEVLKGYKQVIEIDINQFGGSPESGFAREFNQ